SMGGAALAIAEVEQPGTFAALILIEPVILPPPFEPADHPLTSIVLKRRRTFESRKEAAKNFAGKAPFNRWHPAALSGYVEGGLKEHEGRFVLACDPKDEAAIYRAASAHGIWDRLSEIEIPVLVMASDAGGESQLSGYARTIAERLPRGGFEHVAGTSHFLPMEQPELVARRIERLAVVAESDR
ncbi:MAG: alpha/beta hydrolase, partial [Acidimicrobiia bacterium]|nr:alpha/beta hydrolase [Acidimicrobiia bacterium]